MRFIALLDYPVKYYKVAIYHKDAPTFQLILLPCLSGAGEIAFSEPQNAVSLAFRMLNQNLFTKQKGMLKFYDLHLNQIKFHVVSMHYRKHRTCISRASSKDNDPGLQISNGCIVWSNTFLLGHNMFFGQSNFNSCNSWKDRKSVV